MPTATLVKDIDLKNPCLFNPELKLLSNNF